MRKLFLKVVIGCFSLSAFFAQEMVPWTEDLFSTKGTGECAYRCAHTGHPKKYSSCIDGCFRVRAVPLVDVEAEIDVYASSQSTPKFFLQGQKQILCDLHDDPVSLTTFADVQLASSKRAKNPAFFEYAPFMTTFGFGLGTHITITSLYYIQAFTYGGGGVGSSRCGYGFARVGLHGMYKKQHGLLITLEGLKSLPHGYRSYSGFATQKGRAISLEGRYSYRFPSGVEFSCALCKRWVRSLNIKNTFDVIVGCTIPFAW